MLFTTLSVAQDLAGVGGILSTVSICITACALLFAIVCAIVGYRRGLNRSLLRLGTVAFTLLIALLLTLCLKNTINNAFSGVMIDLKSNIPQDLLYTSPSLQMLIDQLPYALFSSFIFGILFFVINIIYYFVI